MNQIDHTKPVNISKPDIFPTPRKFYINNFENMVAICCNVQRVCSCVCPTDLQKDISSSVCQRVITCFNCVVWPESSLCTHQGIKSESHGKLQAPATQTAKLKGTEATFAKTVEDNSFCTKVLKRSWVPCATLVVSKRKKNDRQLSTSQIGINRLENTRCLKHFKTIKQLAYSGGLYDGRKWNATTSKSKAPKRQCQRQLSLSRRTSFSTLRRPVHDHIGSALRTKDADGGWSSNSTERLGYEMFSSKPPASLTPSRFQCRGSLCCAPHFLVLRFLTSGNPIFETGRLYRQKDHPILH